MEEKRIVVKLELDDGREKRKAMKIVSILSGIDSISMDMKEKKLTVTGVVDPVDIVMKLRKYWRTTSILQVGPTKESEKATEKKEEATKKDDDKKEARKKEQKKEGDGDEGKKKEDEMVILEMVRAYNPHQVQNYEYVQNMEENPDGSCTIV